MDKSITITLTRYAEPNWLLFQTLESLSSQQGVNAEVLMLDQKNDQESKAYCEKISNEKINIQYITIPAKSLSFARNEAIRLCETDVLLYIDTDAIAASDWAQQLSKSLFKEGVGISGGKILPKWHKAPSFIQKSNVVLDQYSMLNLGDGEHEVKKVVGANFGLNIARLKDVAHFDENLGRREGKLISGEETQLCLDALANNLKILYQGKAVVEHQVLPERVKFSWIARRMYYQGIASAQRGGAPQPSNKGSYTCWDFIALSALAPFYICGYIHGKRLAKKQK